MTAEPGSPVVAYCAPGLKHYAERILDMSGERYREVIEHPWITSRTDVILTTDADWYRTPHAAGDRL